MDIIVFVDRTTIIIIGPSTSRFATYSNNSVCRREKQTSSLCYSNQSAQLLDQFMTNPTVYSCAQ